MLTEISKEKKDTASKTASIKFRIESERKSSWKRICSKRRVTLSQLIIDSVEDRIYDDERRKVLEFIEKQDHVFVKIETNINQVAKIANSQKFISEKEIVNFNGLLAEVVRLKNVQNEIFKKIYALLGK